MGEPRYVSRVVQDHTSITAFIERKWNLPAMTFRDANAHPMTDYFDFRHPTFRKPPTAPRGAAARPGATGVQGGGSDPPLPGQRRRPTTWRGSWRGRL